MERHIIYINPIGAHGPLRYEFHSKVVAKTAFRESCCPLLNVEAWHLWVGPNPAFEGRMMTCIINYWHMSQAQ